MCLTGYGRTEKERKKTWFSDEDGGECRGFRHNDHERGADGADGNGGVSSQTGFSTRANYGGDVNASRSGSIDDDDDDDASRTPND